MVSKGGQKRFSPRSKPEKEAEMKTLNIKKALWIVCLGFISLYGCAATSAYAPAGQIGSADYLNSGYHEVYSDEAVARTDDGAEKEIFVTAILSYVFTPYLVAPAAVMVNSGIGMIGDAIIPDREDSAVMDLAGTE